MKLKSPSFLFKIFGIIGLLLLAGALYSVYDIQTFNAHAVKTTAVVTDLVRHAGSQGHNDTYSPVFRYEDAAGNTHEYASSTSSSPASFAVGDVADVYYDPRHPDRAKVAGWAGYTGTIILGGMALVFCGVGWTGYFISGPQRHKLKVNGQLLMADIIGVDRNEFLMVNNRHPYIIRCKWRDPLTGEERVFKSEMIMDNPTAALHDRKQLDVYIDPQRPKKYYVDITFLDAKQVG